MATVMQMQATGGPEVLQPAEVDEPTPGEGQALVEVRAAGVNFIDTYQRDGTYPVELPFVPGSEGSGVVRKLGPGVDAVSVGDRVAWTGVASSYASVLVAPATRLIKVPAALDDHQAAALPLQGLTAHYLMHDSYPARPGETVLVHAGAGGAGLLLTQIAVIKGVRVITTVSTPEKADLSRAAGADEVLVGYDGFPDRVPALTGGEGVHAVYDGVGKDTFDGSLASLRRRGFLVLFGGSSGQVPPFDLQRLSRGGSLSVTRPTLGDFIASDDELHRRADDLLGWVADGRLRLRIGGVYPLTDAARAHEDLTGRRTTGKLVLEPGR